MTTPAPSGSPSRRRVAGLALLGIGVIAAIIGLASLFLNGSGNGGQTAAPPPVTATAGTPAPGTTPSPGTPPPATQPAPTDGTVTVPTFGPSPTAGVAAPPPGAPPAPAPGADAGTPGAGGTGGTGGEGSGSVADRGPIRVYNNSTITGLATKAADDFRAAGWEVTDIANYPFGVLYHTTVYYRPGTGEQAAAEELGREFGLRVHERFDGIKSASPGVIVIVTNDYPS